jgi:hypothetical protein
MVNRSGRLAGLTCALLALSFMSPARSLAVPGAASLGPEVEVGEPSDGYVGRLEVSPKNGPAGAPVTLSAEGLPAGQEFEFVWVTANGEWKVSNNEYHGRQYTPVAYRIAKAKSDQAGRLSTTFIAPDDFGYAHDIVLQQGSRLFTQVSFSLDMVVEISPKSGPVGTPIHVDIKGIGFRSLYNSWDLVYDNNFTGWMSAITTHGSASFTIPATGAVGDHILEVIHGELTTPYRNPEQNPAPGRPRWAIPFTITEGPAVLPPPPEQQAQKIVRVLPPPGELAATPLFTGVGEPALVRAEGLVPGKSYQLNWTRVTGNRMMGVGAELPGRAWEESSKPVADSKADASGHAEFQFSTPDDLGGTHGLWIQAGTTKKFGAHVIKPTALPLDVTRGPVGTTFTIHLKGVGWTETANILHMNYDNNYTGYVCAFNSQGDVEIFIKATGTPGWHFIDLYPGIYKGTETRPNNYRIPQLTYADDHPGEDLPAFHYAFEVTPTPRAGQRAELSK